MSRLAFLTGSRVYGRPRPDSDVDLVLLVDEDTRRTLAEFADAGPAREGGYAVRYGRLNLVLLESEREFDAWCSATEALKKRAPVTRDEAIQAVLAAVAEAFAANANKAGDAPAGAR